MPDVDERVKPARKRSKKDTSPRKKALAKSANSERYYARKNTKPKKTAATKAK